MGTTLRPKNTLRQIARLFHFYHMFPVVTSHASGGAVGPPGYVLQGFHLLGEQFDVCQVTGKYE